MSVPRPQGWKYQEPQYWDSYLPQTDDFDDAQGYIDALAAGAEDTSDPAGRYWDPIGEVWRGGRRTEREIALSKYDSGRYMDPNNSFNKGPYSLMRLQNRIGFDPEEARMAYGAHDEFGNPLLDPAILAMIESQLGIGENERPPDNYGSGGERPGGRGDVPYGGGDVSFGGADRTGRGNDGGPDLGPNLDGPYYPGGQPQPGGPVSGSGGSHQLPPHRVAPGGGASSPLVPGTPSTGPVPPMPEPVAELPTQEMAVSTIDPRYPDFILRAMNRKWGSKPTDRLAVY